jgi:hypothetical protein
MKQPWIYSQSVDLLYILLPSYFVCAITGVCIHFFEVSNSEVSPFVWLILIVGVDVSHVYSTLYRTYFDKSEFKQHTKLYLLTPVLCLIVSYALIFFGSLVFFWSIMAYIAIFHFVRQQYGFMRIYTRQEKSSFGKSFSTILIYVVSVIPVLMWHVGAEKSFHWFVEGDLWLWPNPTLYVLLHVLFWIAVLSYVGTECFTVYKSRWLNIPKNVLMAGTALAWYYGIVLNNGDLTFTALNVVSHGVPYMALVWIHAKKKPIVNSQALSIAQKFTQASYLGALGFVSLLLLLAFSEEFLWDNLIWHEHPEFFGYLLDLDVKTMALVFTPLLSLPQLTHYVLDGFIWKIKRDTHEWSKAVLH